MGGKAQEEIRLDIEASMEMEMEMDMEMEMEMGRMYVNSKSAVDAAALTLGHWNLVIQEMVGVAEEFRGTRCPLSELLKGSRGKYLTRCGRKHRPAKGKIVSIGKSPGG